MTLPVQATLGRSGRPAPAFGAMRDELYVLLRRAARQLVAKESPGRTMTATDVAHEAFLRLGDLPDDPPREFLLAVAARIVREVLIDAARTRDRIKRGRGWTRIELADAEEQAEAPAPEIDLLDLDEALRELEARAPRQARVVELRYFGGLTTEEIAEVERCSVRTVGAEWCVARAWLLRRLSEGTARP